MSINEKTPIEAKTSHGSVPATIKPFDGTDPGYTVENYLSIIVAAMILSRGVEPVDKPSHQQWKLKRAAIILHTIRRLAQKWFSTLPETKLECDQFCVEFSNIFDSVKLNERAKILLQLKQKHTKKSLRSLALRT